MKLAKRLWVWRTYLGLTLQGVSDKSGVSVPMLTKVECGIRDLPTRMLLAIVERALKIEMQEFWGALPRVRRATMRGRPRTASRQLSEMRAA
jgi:transcriptional regulator with XRE-family HTH domain